jgi:hypothetical protein
LTFETELRQVQKLEPGDVFLWKEDGRTVTREVVEVIRPRPLGTADVRARAANGAEFTGVYGGRVEVIRPVTLDDETRESGRRAMSVARYGDDAWKVV